MKKVASWLRRTVRSIVKNTVHRLLVCLCNRVGSVRVPVRRARSTVWAFLLSRSSRRTSCNTKEQEEHNILRIMRNRRLLASISLLILSQLNAFVLQESCSSRRKAFVRSSLLEDHDNFNKKKKNSSWKWPRKNRGPAPSSSIPYLKQATDHILLERDLAWKSFEMISLFNAWSSHVKYDPHAVDYMELLLDRLSRTAKRDVVDIEMYNKLLDAWVCSALFHGEERASPRAREILFTLQQNYEETLGLSNNNNNTVSTDDTTDQHLLATTNLLKPNAESFDMVLHVVCKKEGAYTARRLLAWMEFLHKSGRNKLAKPTFADYISVLDTYAKADERKAGVLAEGFLRHMKLIGVTPDTLCYNIAIKAWNRMGRDAAEHAERLLEEMPEPDIVSYGSVIAAWAASGMRSHAVAKTESLLQQVVDHPELEPNTVILNAVMSAWVKSRSPSAVERTREILNDMEEKGIADLISYNTHLHALSLHAKRPGMAQAARRLLEDMENRYASNQTHFAPNLFSYNIVIEGYARSQEPKAAFHAADILRKAIRSETVDPDTYSFQQVLASLSRSNLPEASRIAHDLLNYMFDAFEVGIHPDAVPSVNCYAAVIACYSRSDVKGAASRAEALLHRMKQLSMTKYPHLKPNRVCYNSLIDCWAKSGLGTLAARKAEAILGEMEALFSTGDESMQPNIVTYNALLNAWARSGTRCCGRMAETYLDRMWKLYKEGNTKVKPNDFSYNTVINAISKSKNEGKAQKALRLLRRMDKLYQAGNKEARPNEVTYTAVLNSCAFPAVPDPKTRRKALDTAIFTLEELQSSRYGQPNQVTYGTFIKACANLLDENDEFRREMIERVFRQCCKDGQVGEMVLSYLRMAAPPDLYEELLADFASSGRKLTVEDLPREWRCNVAKRNGWKSRPYSKRKKPSRRPAEQATYR